MEARDDLALMTAGEVAEALQLSKAQIYGLARTGELPAIRVRASVRFRRRTLTEWMARQELATAEEVGR